MSATARVSQMELLSSFVLERLLMSSWKLTPFRYRSSLTCPVTLHLSAQQAQWAMTVSI